MHAMKKEMLPILARIPEGRKGADALNRAVTELDAACGACDGSPESVDALGKAGIAVLIAGVNCASDAEDVSECAHRVWGRLL